MHRGYRVVFSVVALLLLVVAGQSPASLRAEYATDKIAPWVIANTASGAEAEFLVVLAEQADLDRASGLATKVEKGRYVYETLWNTAQATQGPLLAWLKARDVPHRSYYIVNLIWVKGDYDLALTLAARSDVARIEGNPRVLNVAPAPLHPLLDWLDAAPAAVEPGIAYVRAPEVWGMGYTGQGVVVGGQDTGYDWTHPALKSHYRGWDGAAAAHDYNWHDSIHSDGGICGADAPAPCDDHSHGTHTMGTAVGDDGGSNQIGMAPGAQWIGCRNMDEGYGQPSTYLECFEFFLAPYPVGGTPEQGDSSKAPDVTNNSWTCPTYEGCSWNTLQAAVEAQRAAGIMTVVSAGNSGPSCSTVGDPPAIYAAAYTVGALTTGTDTIASLSSRGPVMVDSSNRRKPDLTAPGTSVRSSVLNGGYGYKTGTSMAAPHVAGAVALLWSASPALKNQIAATEQLLNAAAVHITSSECSSIGWPNNVYGYGRLDIKAAVDAAIVPGPYGAAIAPESVEQHADPGEMVQATFTVTNTGQQTDTFTVTLSGGVWKIVAPETVGPLGAGTSAALPVTVTVPSNALYGAADEWTVTSQGDAAQSASATLHTTADAMYGVMLVPPEYFRNGNVGATVVYSLVLTNTGNVSDTYVLALSGATWTTTLAPEGVVLEPAQSAPVTVTVTVPLEAPTGITDTVRVTASGTGVAASSDLTTAAVAADCLPLSGVDFGYVPVSPLVGQTVTFTGSVDVGTEPILYEWGFGDGSVLVTGEAVTHTFPAATVVMPYTVAMTATNMCDMVVVQQTVTVGLYTLYLPLVLK